MISAVLFLVGVSTVTFFLGYFLAMYREAVRIRKAMEGVLKQAHSFPRGIFDGAYWALKETESAYNGHALTSPELAEARYNAIFISGNVSVSEHINVPLPPKPEPK